jgi:3-hydroxyacyl-[acyl-carrier-protein] dehydratase
VGETLDSAGIQSTIPHRFPFLLVDRLVDLERGRSAVGIKNVSAGEPYFAGHFPGHPVMPGVLIVEALAQTAALLVMEPGQGTIPLFMGIDRARFRRPVVPGDQLRLEVEVLQRRRNVVKVRGRAMVGEELAAEAEILATLAPSSGLAAG